MSRKRKNELKGQRFGNLMVLEPSFRDHGNGYTYWECRCVTCGRTLDVRTDSLLTGLSCGCSECNYGRGKRSLYTDEDEEES